MDAVVRESLRIIVERLLKLQTEMSKSESEASATRSAVARTFADHDGKLAESFHDHVLGTTRITRGRDRELEALLKMLG